MKTKAPIELTGNILVEIADLNRKFRMHGGRLFRHMDDLAAQVAFLHSGNDCYTIAGSPFKYFLPVNLEHLLTIRAKIIKSWGASMEIKVEAFRKGPDNKEELVMMIYLYFVAMKDGALQQVPPVLPQTSEEIEEFMMADRRREEVKHFIEKHSSQ